MIHDDNLFPCLICNTPIDYDYSTRCPKCGWLIQHFLGDETPDSLEEIAQKYLYSHRKNYVENHHLNVTDFSWIGYLKNLEQAVSEKNTFQKTKSHSGEMPMLLNHTVMVKVPVRLQGLEIKDLETLRKEIHPDIVDFVRDNEMNILFRFLKSRDHIDLANQVETLQQNCSNLNDAQIFEKTCQILGVEYNQAFNSMFFKENGDRLDSVGESKSEEKSSKSTRKATDFSSMPIQSAVFGTSFELIKLINDVYYLSKNGLSNNYSNYASCYFNKTYWKQTDFTENYSELQTELFSAVKALNKKDYSTALHSFLDKIISELLAQFDEKGKIKTDAKSSLLEKYSNITQPAYAELFANEFLKTLLPQQVVSVNYLNDTNNNLLICVTYRGEA